MKSSKRRGRLLRTLAAVVLVVSFVTTGVVLARNPTELTLAVLAALAVLLVGRFLFSGLLRLIAHRLRELQTAVEFLNEREARTRLPIGRVTADSLEAISHEFNNLLTVILGFSNLALENMGDEDPEWEFLCEIRTAGERAKALTRRLVMVNRNISRTAMADTASRVQPVPESNAEV